MLSGVTVLPAFAVLIEPSVAQGAHDLDGGGVRAQGRTAGVAEEQRSGGHRPRPARRVGVSVRVGQCQGAGQCFGEAARAADDAAVRGISRRFSNSKSCGAEYYTARTGEGSHRLRQAGEIELHSPESMVSAVPTGKRFVVVRGPELATDDMRGPGIGAGGGHAKKRRAGGLSRESASAGGR